MTAKVELLTPSGGKVILDPSDTAVDRTLTLPAVAGTVLNTASDIEAQVKTATSATGDAPIYACRAWVSWDGVTGSGNTINGSGNVSSVVRTATAAYTINFITAMPDTNYCFSGSGRPDSDVSRGVAYTGSSVNTTSLSGRFRDTSNASTNVQVGCIAVFR